MAKNYGDELRRRKLTPPEVGRLWGVSPDRIVHWIRTGELRAINVATKRDGRPRFLIDLDDLADFEAGRAVIPKARPHRRRRKLKSDHVFKFF